MTSYRDIQKSIRTFSEDELKGLLRKEIAKRGPKRAMVAQRLHQLVGRARKPAAAACGHHNDDGAFAHGKGFCRAWVLRRAPGADLPTPGHRKDARTAQRGQWDVYLRPSP
jgi:hypothetical protein